MKKIIVFILLMFSSLHFYAQQSDYNSDTEEITAIEAELQSLFKTMTSSKADSIKLSINSQITEKFNQILALDSSFYYSFDSLKYMGKVGSDDGLLRIFTWNIQFKDGKYKYFGFIKYYNETKKQFSLFSLNDTSDEIIDPQQTILSNLNWFGALYYDIIEQKKGSRTFYTLLGWDGNNYHTTKKIIDVLYFKSRKPVFGAKFFKIEKTYRKRVIFEYSNRADMVLKYEKKKNWIAFDHLSPSKPEYKGMRQYYGPDFSVDAFKFEDGKWIYIPDIDARNAKKKSNPRLKNKKDLKLKLD